MSFQLLPSRTDATCDGYKRQDLHPTDFEALKQFAYPEERGVNCGHVGNDGHRDYAAFLGKGDRRTLSLLIGRPWIEYVNASDWRSSEIMGEFASRLDDLLESHIVDRIHVPYVRNLRDLFQMLHDRGIGAYAD